MRRFALLAAVSCALTACVGGGPRTQSILEDESATVVVSESNTPFVVVGMNAGVADQASGWLARTTAMSFVRNTGAAPVVIGAGDIINISIVSTSESGFIDLTNSTLSPISTTDLPQQEVGTDGMVSVPPIGRVNAAGLSVQALEDDLSRRLGDVLVDPSVIIRIAERRSARVSVLGDVQEPGTFNIDQTNMKLVEMIALAGGPEDGLAENLQVSFSRSGVTGRAPLNRVYENPGLNIEVRAGDVISIEEPAYRLTVIGALGNNQTLIYNEPDLTLADALGRAGGLVDRRADRKGVFIYRELPTEQVSALGVDTLGFTGASVPVIFNLDLSKPQALFAAKKFAMGENDLIYISDSLNNELDAVFETFRLFVPLPSVFVADAAFN